MNRVILVMSLIACIAINGVFADESKEAASRIESLEQQTAKLKRDVENLKREMHQLRTVSVLRQQWSLKDVLKKIALDHKLKPEELRKRSRLSLVSSCRKKFSFISCRVLGFPVEEVAGYLNLSGPAVSWSIIKGEELVTQKDISIFINSGVNSTVNNCRRGYCDTA